MPGRRALAPDVARGALVNLVFTVVIGGLAGAEGLIVPRILGPTALGLYGIASGGVMVGVTLKSIDLPSKLVQERQVDLFTAYRVAFTLDMALSGAFFVLVLAAAPLLAFAYKEPVLWPLTSVLGLSIFAVALMDLPAAIPFREMRYFRRRAMLSVVPVLGFAVTVSAAAAGLGVWSLAAGTLAGLAGAALALLRFGRIRPGFAWEGAVARRFLDYGWPLWLGGIITAAAGWAGLITVSATVGIAGVGFWALAHSVATQALQVDAAVSDALFPVLCNVQGTKTLRRAFVRLSRLSMMWAAPVGFGLVIFAVPAIDVVLGHRWLPAVVLIRAEGAGIVVNSIGYSWDVLLASQGITRPQLTVSLLAAGWIALIVIPLLILFGLNGAALSIVVLAVGTYAVRQIYLQRLLGRLVLAAIVWRETLAAGLAAGLVELLRMWGWSAAGLGGLTLQAIAYLALVVMAYAVTSRELVVSAWRSVRTTRSPAGSGVARPSAPVDDQKAGAFGWDTPWRAAFPLLVSADPDGRTLWVTVRDWPALGRLDTITGQAEWFPTDPFPHAPSPDGAGGCWTALTRASALIHVGIDGVDHRVSLPRSRELFVTALTAQDIWVTDPGNRALVAVDRGDLTPRVIPLPDVFSRPDYVVADQGGSVWVADPEAAVLGRLDRTTGLVQILEITHPVRALLATPTGLWLGASHRAMVSRSDQDGRLMGSVDLPGIPSGMATRADGSLVVAIPSENLVAVVSDESGAARAVTTTILTGESSMPFGVACIAQRVFVVLALASKVIELSV